MAKDRIILSQMNPGNKATGCVLLTKVEEAAGQNGSYCKLSISDGGDTVTAKMWGTSLSGLSVKPKTVIKANIECTEYRGKKDYIIRSCSPSEDESINISDFVERAPLDPETMYREIVETVKSVPGNGDYKSLGELTESIYEDNKSKLLYWSAAENIHHNMYAGLLYHTYRMLKQAEMLVKVYPSLNPELLFSAVALHDIGKLVELDTDECGTASYTAEGRLFGHAVIGMQIIDKKTLDGEYDPEKVKCLKHCIASHHGRIEWGAVVLPQIEEASILHYIDMIDSRVQQYEKTESTMEPGTETDDMIFGLDRVKVYKPGFKK